MKMNELHGIPLDVFAKGRPYEKVLEEYMKIWANARKYATAPGKGEDEIFADTMTVTIYRMYLLGVEDGMKEEIK